MVFAFLRPALVHAKLWAWSVLTWVSVSCCLAAQPIFLVNARSAEDLEAENARTVTEEQHGLSEPKAISPAGNLIAEVAEYDGLHKETAGLFVRRRDDSTRHRIVAAVETVKLPGGGEMDYRGIVDPFWNHSGTELVFDRWVRRGPVHIWKSREDGSGLAAVVWKSLGPSLTFGPSEGHFPAVPVSTFGAKGWSRDDKWILVQMGSDEPNTGLIGVVHLDGSGLKILTWGEMPHFSELANYITFIRRDDKYLKLGPQTGLYDLDTGRVVVLPVRSRGGAPALSPDKRFVAYENDGLWIANVDGSSARKIHELPVELRGGQGFGVEGWSADGRTIRYKHMAFPSGQVVTVEVTLRNRRGK